MPENVTLAAFGSSNTPPLARTSVPLPETVAGKMPPPTSVRKPLLTMVPATWPPSIISAPPLLMVGVLATPPCDTLSVPPARKSPRNHRRRCHLRRRFRCRRRKLPIRWRYRNRPSCSRRQRSSLKPPALDEGRAAGECRPLMMASRIDVDVAVRADRHRVGNATSFTVTCPVALAGVAHDRREIRGSAGLMVSWANVFTVVEFAIPSTVMPVNSPSSTVSSVVPPDRTPPNLDDIDQARDHAAAEHDERAAIDDVTGGVGDCFETEVVPVL